MLIRAEDIMTGRRLLKCSPAGDPEEAARIAASNQFDVVPLPEVGGAVRRFWSRPAGAILRVTRQHRANHDTPVAALLRPLFQHGVQFVYFRSELVGLLDVSDLNKPLARLGLLSPMLHLEQQVMNRARRMNLSDDSISQWASKGEVRRAKSRQARAATKNLSMPLLEFMGFGSVLAVARGLGWLQLTDGQHASLVDLRNRCAHATREIIDRREGREKLLETIALAVGIQGRRLS